MPERDRTLEQSWLRSSDDDGGDDGPPVPGLLVVFSGRRAELHAIPLFDRPRCLGRGTEADDVIDDSCMSRRHAEVSIAGGRFVVRDLGSRNGTFVDGEPATDGTVDPDARVLRTGDTLSLLCADVRPFRDAVVDLADGQVTGPTLRGVYDEIAAAARAGATLHVTGESGSGKELAARRFHAYGPRAAGPFVAVNCATIPAPLAERLLFGARRGAYSGADADSEGHLQAADGGTLFLDEIAELPADVQAKLLRVLETREVQPLGAARSQAIDVRFCSASHGDLRAAAGAGKFRDDLYFRIGRPAVALPPLRERPEEIPWLLQAELGRIGGGGGLSLHVTLVETALLRPWPGNVRELKTELGDAARRAVAAGSKPVMGRHLNAGAGQPLAAAPAGDEAGEPAEAQLTRMKQAERDVIARALAEHKGSILAAARALGLSRSTLYRKIEKYGLA